LRSARLLVRPATAVYDTLKLPIFMLHINGVFAAMKTYVGIIQPIIMIVFNLGIGVVFYVLIKKTFKRHAGWN